MKYTKLGRTGLLVSKLGFGTGGHFCLGQRNGVPEREIHKLIHSALDLGYNLFDTSPGYLDSEAILCRALRDVPRDRYLLSDKVVVSDNDGVHSPRKVVESIEGSLQRLGVDSIDILLLAGPCLSEQYRMVHDDLIPTIERLKEEGKVRYVGSSEKSSIDGNHEWLAKGLSDDLFDVIMAGYNIFNQSASRTIFPLCRRLNVGVLNIYTVRNAFRDKQHLEETIENLRARGLIEDNFTLEAFKAIIPMNESPASVAYKFAAANDSVNTIMVTCSSVEHLRENVESIMTDPLPDEILSRFRQLFRKIDIPVGT